ncbi:GNAT family N-acetyltransferase [Mycobacterium sp.]|uniref:GNAT family N-acetyltransferase n=1 Tax=Mycobacterium sp. TaxID=1785 RepID=UPI002C38789F|nr:GNAT family N-acetyltransferase [Mycobacterium sp.]HTQ21863.1 GNAT family N-acetyltransferase [Mycobacterium sp.]
MSPETIDDRAACRLLDGRRILLRCLSAGDTKALVALHQHLSDRDRYLRFFTLNPVHLDELVTKLSTPAAGQCALGAFDGHRLIGVANYQVSDHDSAAADVAIVVAHEDHLRGVGTALLGRLAAIAKTHGVRRFIADVLTENHLMLKVFSDLAWPRERTSYGPVCHLEFELPETRVET